MCVWIALVLAVSAVGCGESGVEDAAVVESDAETESGTDPDASRPTGREPETGTGTGTDPADEDEAATDPTADAWTLAIAPCDADERFCEANRRLVLVRSAIYGAPFTETPAEIEALMAESDALTAEWVRLAPDELRPLIDIILSEFSEPIDAMTEEFGWDPYAAINSEEALAISEDPTVNATLRALDAYHGRCCKYEENLTAPTDPLIVGDRTIAVYNGTPALNEALRWALERFDLAGLEVPPIGSATFTVQSEMCDDIRGLYRPTDRGIELELCMNEQSMCWEDPDADPLGDEGHCPARLPGMAAVVLHEIAHVWLDANVDNIDVDRFLAHVELETWRGRDLPWEQRGHEHAADTIAWGLMDRDIEMLRVGQPTAEELTKGFRILTGTDPLPKNT